MTHGPYLAVLARKLCPDFVANSQQSLKDGLVELNHS